MTEDFQYWVRENSYKLSNEQQKEIKEFIRTCFSRRVSEITTIDLTSPVHDDDGGSIQRKSVAEVTLKSLSLDPFEPSSSRTSMQLHASDDLSLLGPGQISIPVPAQINTEDDLSLLGPGQMPQLIDSVTGLKKLPTEARPFSETSSQDRSPGIFQDITLSSGRSRLLSSNARDFDSTNLSNKEKSKGSSSAGSHAQRKRLANEKSRTSKNSAKAVSQLGIVGDLGHERNTSVLSLGTSSVPKYEYQQITLTDGNSDARHSLLSRDELSMRQRRRRAEDECRLRNGNALTTKGLKKSNKKPRGKKPSLQKASHANGKMATYFVYDTSSAEDGEEVLATWLSLNSKSINPSPVTRKGIDLTEISFNSPNTSNGISIEGSSKITSGVTDLRDVPQGSSSTSFRKNESKKLTSSHDANDQSNLTSNPSESLSRAKSIKANKGGK